MERGIELKKLDQKDDNVINFDTARKALTFGGTGIDENWLLGLQPGTVFTCRENGTPKTNLILDLYCIVEHKDTITNMIRKIPTGQTWDAWYPTLEFSRLNKFQEIVTKVDFTYSQQRADQETADEQALEKTDGTSDRTIHEG